MVSKHIRRQPSKKTLSPVQYAKRNVQKPLSFRDKEKKIKFDAYDKNTSNEETKGNVKKDGDNGGDVVDNSSEKSGNKRINDDNDDGDGDDNDNDNDDQKMDFKADDDTKSEQKKSANHVKFENVIKNTSAKVSFNFRKRHLLRSPKLSNVIEKLITRVSEKPMNVTTTQTGPGIHFTSSSRSNDLLFAHQHVSPRKRILREFEKVSLEDRNSNTQKRSRSKSNVSNDCAMVSSSKLIGSNYSIVVAQQTANISCSNKEENNQVANGSPPRSHSSNSAEVSTLEKTFKNSRSVTSTNTLKNNVVSNEIASQPVSKPISNYSIISLLGHNNSSNNSDSKNETNTEDKAVSENRGSSRSPMSYNHQMLSNNRSSYVPKKKSPSNSGNTLVNSPTNYRNARSPDINSPSPGLQHNRYHPASLASPTSSFHPYLSSSRASPQSSGTLSPTDLYRHRSYRTAGSPSTMSNSSVSGLTHQYTPLNGSPTPFANRYSPSTYSNSTKTSPTQSSQSQSLSSTYNVSSLLPQNYDPNTPSVGENHIFSPNVKHRTSDWSPARNAAASGRGSPSNHANSNNSLSTTTIPKKTASIRQKYGSLSPNGFAGGGINSESTSSNKGDSNTGNKLLSDSMLDAKPVTKRSRSPIESHKKSQTQELYEKDLQARYNAEVAAMHHQSLIASALQQQAASPFYHMYAGGNLNAANLPPSMSAAAAYMNPLYYHHHPASEIFRKTHPSAAMDLLHKNIVPSWVDPYNASMMHYPPIPGSGLISDKLAAKSQSEVHSMLMSPYSLGRPVSVRDQQPVVDIETWNTANNKRSPVESPASAAGSAFRRQSQQFSEPISLIKDEQSSGKIKKFKTLHFYANVLRLVNNYLLMLMI